MFSQINSKISSVSRFEQIDTNFVHLRVLPIYKLPQDA